MHVVRPHGLTLEEVGYPADELLAARNKEARNMRTLPGGAGCCLTPSSLRRVPGGQSPAADACASPRRRIWRNANSARSSPVVKTAVSFVVTFLPLVKPAIVK